MLPELVFDVSLGLVQRALDEVGRLPGLLGHVVGQTLAHAGPLHHARAERLRTLQQLLRQLLKSTRA